VMLLQRFVLSFLLTSLAELPFFLLFCKDRRNGLPVYLLVNLMTNPAAVLLSLLLRSAFPEAAPFFLQLPIELAVIVAEALVYRSFREVFPKPVVLSVTANCFSYALGLLL